MQNPGQKVGRFNCHYFFFAVANKYKLPANYKASKGAMIPGQKEPFDFWSKPKIGPKIAQIICPSFMAFCCRQLVINAN